MSFSATFPPVRNRSNITSLAPILNVPELPSNMRPFVSDEPEVVEILNVSGSDTTLQASSPSLPRESVKNGLPITLPPPPPPPNTAAPEPVIQIIPELLTRKHFLELRLKNARELVSKHQKAAEQAQRKQIEYARAVGAAGAEAFEEGAAQKKAEFEVEGILRKIEQLDEETMQSAKLVTPGEDLVMIEERGRSRQRGSRADPRQSSIDLFDEPIRPLSLSPEPPVRRFRPRPRRAISPDLSSDIGDFNDCPPFGGFGDTRCFPRGPRFPSPPVDDSIHIEPPLGRRRPPNRPFGGFKPMNINPGPPPPAPPLPFIPPPPPPVMRKKKKTYRRPRRSLSPPSLPSSPPTPALRERSCDRWLRSPSPVILPDPEPIWSSKKRVRIPSRSPSPVYRWPPPRKDRNRSDWAGRPRSPPLWPSEIEIVNRKRPRLEPLPEVDHFAPPKRVRFDHGRMGMGMKWSDPLDFK